MEPTLQKSNSKLLQVQHNNHATIAIWIFGSEPNLTELPKQPLPIPSEPTFFWAAPTYGRPAVGVLNTMADRVGSLQKERDLEPMRGPAEEHQGGILEASASKEIRKKLQEVKGDQKETIIKQDQIKEEKEKETKKKGKDQKNSESKEKK